MSQFDQTQCLGQMDDVRPEVVVHGLSHAEPSEVLELEHIAEHVRDLLVPAYTVGQLCW